MGIFETWNASIEPHIPAILEIIYWIMGLQLVHTGYRVLKDQAHPKKFGTALFWFLTGVTFIGGSFLPPMVTGAIICVLGALALFKQVQIGTLPTTDEATVVERSEHVGGKIFIPVLALGFIALIVSKLFPSMSAASVGVAAVVATVLALLVTKAKGGQLLDENHRMLQQVGTTGILPQLLAALGAVFTAAGVGDVIAQLIGGVVPADNRFFGVVAYVLGMVVFTAIMGNAFAAFTVITAGIGVPFVFALGADPIVAGSLAMTAGFCGTLLTPMAGNFNALPAALLEMKDEYGVIKAQAPIAFVMIIVHIALMYFMAY